MAKSNDTFDGILHYVNETNEVVNGLGFHYQLLKGQQGSGSSGVVIMALDKLRDNIVACKIIKAEYTLIDFNFATDVEEILHLGNQVANVNSIVFAQNISWILQKKNNTAIEVDKVVAAFKVDSIYHRLSLKHCEAIWGQINIPFNNRMQRLKSNGESVVAPIVPVEYIRFLSDRKDILREAYILWCLQGHQSIIPIHNFFCNLHFETANTHTFYIVMDKAEKTLYEVMSSRLEVLRTSTVRKYLYQILNALVYCHDRGVIHLDMKPTNILILNNNAYLADFGFSVIYSEYGNMPFTMKKGTDGYRAPELEYGQTCCFAADSFSFGVTIYRALCLAYPFPLLYKRLSKSPIYQDFKIWALENFTRFRDYTNPSVTYHSIFDKSIFTIEIKNLLANLLYPYPANRMTSREALDHPWFLAEADLVRQLNESLAANAAAVNDITVDIEGMKLTEAAPVVPPQLVVNIEESKLTEATPQLQSDPL